MRFSHSILLVSLCSFQVLNGAETPDLPETSDPFWSAIAPDVTPEHRRRHRSMCDRVLRS